MTEQEIEEMLKAALVTVAIVALILAVSQNQVIKMIRQGRLEAINVGTGSQKPVYRVKTESVRRLLDGVA
jgi:helix-turn-helix protein